MTRKKKAQVLIAAMEKFPNYDPEWHHERQLEWFTLLNGLIRLFGETIPDKKRRAKSK